MTDLQDRLADALADRYRLEGELGQGGMATVHLAWDLRHERRVAIKVLRPELAAVIGAGRFLREIRTIATLQHPHILGLIDSGEAQGTAYYVMPFVEGESLRDQLRREKQLPIADAVRIATEVASALDYAHRHGVIHRDIKPENVMLHDGSALVADFGIALAVSSAGGGSRMTETGMSLGTPHYMSPEQAMGEREITARSDVYALGAMTYEMLTGDPPFTGSTAQAIVARAMTERPRAIRSQRHTVTEVVEDAVLTALEKLPADRFASAAEFAAALASERAHPTRRRSGISHPATAPGTSSRGRMRDPVVLGLGAVALASLAVAIWARRPTPTPVSPVVRFNLPLPAGGPTSAQGNSTLAISPDGRTLIYLGEAAGRKQQLMLRTLDDPTPRPLPGTEDGNQPIFSPDGRWVAFFRANQLFRIAVDGSAPQLLGPALGSFNGFTWCSNGQLVISSNVALYLIPEAGGPARTLGRDSGEVYRTAPVVCDEAGGVLYASWASSSPADVRIALAPLDGGPPTIFDLKGTNPLGVVDGRLLYVTVGGVLMGAPVDLAARRILGQPVQLLDNVAVNTGTGLAQASLSQTGTLVYQSGSQLSQVVLAGAGGQRRVLLGELRNYAHPRLSPDGRTLAFAMSSADRRDVWLDELASGTLTRLTTDGTTNERPEWTPDGRRVLYRTDRGTRTSIYWRPVDLSAESSPLLTGRRLDIFEAVLSPDGRYLVYQLDTLGADIYYRSVRDDTTTKVVSTSAAAIETMPRLSPDGRWIAFVTSESGRDEVVVQPFPGPGGRVQVSTGGGTEPVWARDGRRVFYRTGSRLMAATVRTGPDLTVSSRDTIMADPYVYSTNPHANYDVMPDGKHFVMLEPAEAGEVMVVVNWLKEVGERMGVNRRR